MALFTIPTSIGGVNIPGNLFGGPLDSLFQKDGLEFVQYPRDLGSSTKLHSVQFTIEEINEMGLPPMDVGGGIDNMLGSIGNSFSSFGNFASMLEKGTSAVSNGISNTVDAGRTGLKYLKNNSAGQVVNDLGTQVGNFGTQLGKLADAVTVTKGTPVAYISLYLPETLNFSSSMSYDNSVTIASAAGALPLGEKNVVSRVTGFLENNDAARLALNKAGYVFNPQKQLLFKGIDFRQFNMSFTFTPYSQKEADDVKKIIKLFRKWAAPKKSGEAAGMFWVPPALFGIEFQFQGSRNENLPRLQKCVVESVDVNYAPGGWSAHSDGAPVQTTMTIQFQEILLVGRDEVEKGY